jgi:hypothetical protein
MKGDIHTVTFPKIRAEKQPARVTIKYNRPWKVGFENIREAGSCSPMQCSVLFSIMCVKANYIRLHRSNN